jgi:hypothetical protein
MQKKHLLIFLISFLCGVALVQIYFVLFSQDTVVKIGSKTLYISQNSKANEVIVGDNSLTVNSILSPNFFELKTDSFTLLKLEPKEGGVSLGILEQNLDGYLKEWQENTTSNVSHLLGGFAPGALYKISVNGNIFQTVEASENGTISFERKGNGLETYRIEGCNFKLSGGFTSKNLLAGQIVYQIKKFTYKTSLSQGTSIKVQFSQDKTRWVNSQNQEGAWETLLNGENQIDLTGLNWSGPNFYYRAELNTQDCSLSPQLQSVGVIFLTLR